MARFMSEQAHMSHASTLWGSMRRHFAGRGLWPSAKTARSSPPTLSAREAYRLWAPTYADETATSALDEQLAHEMLMGLPREDLLDAGCGIGRRIAAIPGAIGLDASPEMLAAGRATNVVSGDVRSMPFADGRFSMVWCRLVLGHLSNPLPAYLELARVCRPGGYVFVTDFHPEAAAAGHRRIFTDQSGTMHEVEHYVHHDHIGLAAQARLSFIARREGAVGPSIREYYLRGLGRKIYNRDLNLKLVAAFLFRRPQ
jgi:malonyl-CoA O-methyltransferase